MGNLPAMPRLNDRSLLPLIYGTTDFSKWRQRKTPCVNGRNET